MTDASNLRHPWVWHGGVLALLWGLVIVCYRDFLLHWEVAHPHLQDGFQFLWGMWWWGKALGDPTLSPFHSTWIFYPDGADLRLTTLNVLHCVLSLPLQLWLPVHQIGILFILANSIATATATYALACRLYRSPVGGLVAGLAFTFSLYMVTRSWGHYNLIATAWLPLGMLLLLGLRERPWRNGLLYGVVLLGAAYSCLYYMMYLALMVPLWMAWEGPRDVTVVRRALLPLLAGGGLLLVGFSPVWVPVVLEGGAGRIPYQPWVTETFRLHPESLFVTDMPVSWAQGAISEVLGVSRRLEYQGFETSYYIGYGALVLAVFGSLFLRRSREMGFVIVIGAAFLVLASSFPAPLINRLPFFSGLRVTNRYGIVFLLAVYLVAGLGAKVLWSWRRPVGPILAFSGTVLIAVESLPSSLPYQRFLPNPLFFTIADDPEFGSVLTLPLNFRPLGVGVALSGEDMYAQVFHRKPILLGEVMRYPEGLLDDLRAQPFLGRLISIEMGREAGEFDLKEEIPRARDFIEDRDLRYLLIRRESYDWDAVQQERLRIQSKYIGLVADLEYVGEEWGHMLFRIRAKGGL